MAARCWLRSGNGATSVATRNWPSCFPPAASRRQRASRRWRRRGRTRRSPQRQEAGRSRRQWQLSKSPTELSRQQAKIVDTLKQQCPGFAVRRQLVLGCRTILRVGKLTTLHRWMERARNTGIHALVRFVRTLKQDLRAVEAAVSQRWSNGPVEGQINRLKMLKRQMYGRAGIELLRARLLPDAVFTDQ